MPPGRLKGCAILGRQPRSPSWSKTGMSVAGSCTAEVQLGMWRRYGGMLQVGFDF